MPAFSSSNRQRRTELVWISPHSTFKEENVSESSKNAAGRSLEQPSGRSLGARRTHLLRTGKTEIAIAAAIKELKFEGARCTLAAISAKVNISREHLGRKYRGLIRQFL